jgi:hypothetical protein
LIENVLKRANDVFVDVNDEFSSLATIKGKFEEWKRRDIASYKVITAFSVFSQYF